MGKSKERNHAPEEILSGSQETRRRNEPPTLGVNFTEAVGKIIAFVNVVNDPPNWQSLEIRFTDGTLLHFEFLTTETRIKPRYMEARHGDLELIRSYGTLLTDDEITSRQGATGGDEERQTFKHGNRRIGGNLLVALAKGRCSSVGPLPGCCGAPKAERLSTVLGQGDKNLSFLALSATVIIGTPAENPPHEHRILSLAISLLG